MSTLAAIACLLASGFVDTMQDTWVATDGLGRRLPTAAEVGPRRNDRTVAIFFFLWHCNYYKGTSYEGPFDISKMLEKDPDLMKHPDSPMFGPFGRFHHWGEPLLGYYIGTDKSVYRRHAQWLTDAGVDAIIFDTTNGPTYDENYMTLLDAFAEHEAAGGKAPKIAFMCPFAHVPTGRNTLRGSVVRRLWEKLYKPGVHPELWFRWDGKPLILSYPTYCDGDPLLLLDAIGDIRKDEKLRHADRLEVGRVLAQSFEVNRPFIRVSAATPTWRSRTPCSVRMTLKRDGGIVAEQIVDNIFDNNMTPIVLKQSAPPGRYVLELSDPVGTVGWWTRLGGEHRGAFVDGKPVGGFRHLKVEQDDPEAERMKRFFTFRSPDSGCGYHHDRPTKNGAWAWSESYPQIMHYDPDGHDEMVAVSVALNATASKGPVPMNCGQGVIGRRWHDGASDPDPVAIDRGTCFQEQWNRALELDPRLVFVTGWNEWIMTRIRNWCGWEIPAGNFVDQYCPEFSRDIEPVRGYWGDAFYWQLAANIRRYKGAREVPRVESGPIVVDGRFADWRTVEPEFRDDAGDPVSRDHEGWGAAGPYVDHSGRNDIVAAKVSRSASGDLAFYVRTRESMTSPGKDWMRLFIDADRDASTGWMGYDFMVERDGDRSVLRAYDFSKGGFAWSSAVASADCAFAGCEMELSLPYSGFNGRLVLDGFDFKWEDNCIQAFDWTDFALHGDAAPNGRFNYRAVFEDETEVIQKRLDECFKAGGGTVTLDAGVHRVRGLRLRSNTTLHLSRGCVLKASRNCSEFDVLSGDKLEPVDRAALDRSACWLPASQRGSGYEYASVRKVGSPWNDAIIRIVNAHDVAIVGDEDSVIDGCNSYDPLGEEHYRGVHGISVHGLTNGVFRGYTIRRTGNWAHNVWRGCKLRFEDLKIEAGHDGVHFSTCDDVVIRGCRMETGDDCVAGFDNGNVLVEDCDFNTACSAFRIGGTDYHVRNVNCHGPAKYLFRGSLSLEDKVAGAMSRMNGRRNMLSLMTYYADRTIPVRRLPGNIVFENIACENVDRFLHYNYSGNEAWQKAMPLADVEFRNVKARGVSLPLCAYGDRNVNFRLTLKNVDISFRSPIREFIRGAFIDSVNVDGLRVDGAENAPFVRSWAGEKPKAELRNVSGVSGEVVAGDGVFKVKPI